MAEEYYRCTACRRCKASCPLGIDHGLITHLARWLLAEVNVIPKALVVAVRAAAGQGEHQCHHRAWLKDTCEFLEEELHEMAGIDARFPFDG
jgi:Fe-S oxidoreductase